jgi:1-acyl-sn-glycerol-3-phosphate acyltransferase
VWQYELKQRRLGTMLQDLCSHIFKAAGWTFESNIPEDLRSFVMIGAPHTSNFDFIPAMTVAKKMGRNTKFVIKNTWLRFPLNFVLEPIGAHGIDRSKQKTERQSHVQAMAALFAQYPELVLMISPEGTRSPNDQWRTGFYYVAQTAKVPIVLGYADYKRKVAGLSKVLYPKDFATDMKEIMNFYATIHGRRPESFKLDSRYL